MKFAIVTSLAVAVLFGLTQGVLAAPKEQKKSGLSCAQRCAAYCAKNFPAIAGCPDRCTTKQCNR